MNTITLMRYPGGKAKIYKTVRKIIEANGLSNRIYVEPFAGGFGLGLKLMLNKDVKHFIINDFDYHIYALWFSVFHHTEELIEKIITTRVSLAEWHFQKEVYQNFSNKSLLEIGFSTLFLNRTNFSGILNARPMGGLNQEGKYKIDCRFNKKSIVDSIRLISKYKDRVEIYNMDAKELIKYLKNRESHVFYNFDPPYVNNGKKLYLNAFEVQDHIDLRNVVKEINTEWIMTYDNVDMIKDLYDDFKLEEVDLIYSVCKKRREKEIFISNILTF